MSTPEVAAPQPGMRVGSTSEFSLFFRVKAGQGPSLRAALVDLQDTPGYRPGDYGMAIQTIHEARFVLFDDDTRLAFVTSFDGPWDAYMEDFFTSGPTLALFDVIFRHVEGYDGLPDLSALRAFVLGRRADSRGVCPKLPWHGQGDPEGAARERRFPAGARPSSGRRDPSASSVAAAAGRGRRLTAAETGRCHVGPHLRAPSPGGPNRGHHRRVRVPEPRPARRSRAGREHASYGQACRSLLRRASVPLPAATCSPRATAGAGWRFIPGEEEVVLDCVFDASECRAATAEISHLRSSRALCDPVTRENTSPSASTTSREARGTACGSSPVRAGTRSSWTPAQRWPRSRRGSSPSPTPARSSSTARTS